MSLEQVILEAARKNDDSLDDLLHEAFDTMSETEFDRIYDKVHQIMSEALREARGYTAPKIEGERTMTLQEAIQDSAYDSASHIERGYGYYVDGSISDGYSVTEGVEGMPVTGMGHYSTIEQVIAALPADVAQSDEWEAVGEAEA